MNEPYAAGSVVEKRCSEFGDGHCDGSRAHVVEVLGPLEIPGYRSRYGYFVLWEDYPIPVFIHGDRLKFIHGGN